MIPNDAFLCDGVESAANAGSIIAVRKGGAKILLHRSGCTKLVGISDGERLEWRGAGAVVGGHGDGEERRKEWEG